MEKEFVPYELAVKLKELGFDFEDNDILGFYSIKYGVTTHQQLTKNDGYNPAILYQQAFRWFREKYELFCWIEKFHVNETYIFQIPPANFTKIQGHYITYEEAELACLRKLIEIVQGGNK